jgi:hypothetical protein
MAGGTEFDTYRMGDTLEYKYNYDYASETQKDDWINNRCKAKGVVIARDVGKLFINVKIPETCDRKGIVVFDGEKVLFYDKKQKKWKYYRRRTIKRAHINDELWFRYDSWYSNN